MTKIPEPDKYGAIVYRVNGRIHRADGPAIINRDGTQIWYKNGTKHRDNGPTIEWKSGTKEWLHYGKRHRKDAPAIENPNGVTEWWLNGKQHRIDGPAIITKNCNKWYMHGQYHRLDGPAIEFDDGHNYWYINGFELSFEQWLDKTQRINEDNKEMIIRQLLVWVKANHIDGVSKTLGFLKQHVQWKEFEIIERSINISKEQSRDRNPTRGRDWLFAFPDSQTLPADMLRMFDTFRR